MRLKLALLTTALAFGLGTTAALAEDAPGAKSDITIVENNPSANNVPGTSSEGKGDSLNPGALSAPEKTTRARLPAAVVR
jgi:hypothetical protein